MQVRLQPDTLGLVDKFCSDWERPITRPQAVRMLLNEGLRKHGYLKGQADAEH